MAAQQLRELAPEDLNDLSPVQPYSLFVFPFMGNGFTPSGIYVQYDERLFPIIGRVLRTHPSCKHVVPGDVVVFRPQAYDWVHLDGGGVTRDGRSFALMDERALLAILEGYDSHEVTLVA